MSRAEEARLRILAAARELFLLKGFNGVSTAMLANHAKTSKATLYKCFKDMNEVLEEIVKMEESRIGADVVMTFSDHYGFLAVLQKFGESLLQFLNDPDIPLMEGVLAEYGKVSPELAGHFYELSYGTSTKRLMSILEQANQANLIELPTPPDVFSELLIASWEGLDLAKARLGVIKLPYKEPSNRVRLIIDLMIEPYLTENKK